MKREFLSNFKVGEQVLPGEVIDAILDENGRDMESIKAQYSDYDQLKAQLAEASKTIEGLKAMDLEGVQKAAEAWKQKAQQAEQEAQARIAALEFDHLLDGAVTAAKGRNAKAIKALLDLEHLQGSENREQAVTTALEGLKKEHSYLFEGEVPAPYAAGTGTAPIAVQPDRAAFARMSYRERVALKQSDPGLYEQMKNN